MASSENHSSRSLQLLPCNPLKDREPALRLIAAFWKAHNGVDLGREEILEDFNAWTAPGNSFRFVALDGDLIGFAHLGSRGDKVDWLEDLFILQEFQGRGIGSEVIRILEKEVREYSDALYMEVAATNLKALKLYHRLGYDCLNTVTVRKELKPEKTRVIGEETLAGLRFEIREYLR